MFPLDRKTLWRIAGAIFLFYLAIYYWSGVSGFLVTLCAALKPLVLGFAIAYLVNILMNVYESYVFGFAKTGIWRSLRRPICMLLAFASLILIVVGVCLLIIPELVLCLQVVVRELPKVITEGFTWLESNVTPEQWGYVEAVIGDINLDMTSIIKNISNFLMGGISGMSSVISQTFSGVITFFVGLFFSIYFLAGKETLGGQIRRLTQHYIKPSWYERLSYVMAILHKSFHRFIVGQCAEAVILGLLCTFGMMLFRFPYANMVGALVGFTALIPIAGAYIGAGVGAFMIFTVSPIKALFFLLFIVILQQLEGNLIYPRVVGASIGLPGVWVLAAITLGGALMGVSGMLLGVPLVGACYQLLRDDMHSQPLRHKHKTQTSEEDLA